MLIVKQCWNAYNYRFFTEENNKETENENYYVNGKTAKTIDDGFSRM